MMVSIAHWSSIFLAALSSHVVVGMGPDVSFVPSLIRANTLSRHTSRKKNVSLFSIGSDFAKDVARAVQPSVALVTPIGVRNMTDRGSGFVVDFDGTDESDSEEEYLYLLTSAHVVIPGKRIEVAFPVLDLDPATTTTTTTTFDATVIDRDVAIDLALIRVQRNANISPPALKLYDGVAEVGTLAFAHGYPGGVSGAAMTSGIVCATTKGLGLPSVRSGRTLQEPFLQANETVFVVTDAAMAGGMSGGPLVSVDGTVLGVNALVRPDLRALGNYAVSASECRSFLTKVAATQLLMASSTKTSTDSGVTGNGDAQNIGYRVVLYNDPMNTRARVAKVLNDIADLNADDANQVMMDAHTTGSGIVREFILGDDCAKFAQDLCESLRQQDVLVEVERL